MTQEAPDGGCTNWLNVTSDLKALARDIRHGQVFGSWQLRRQSDIARHFIVLNFTTPDQMKQMAEADIVHVYEYRNRSVDNWSVFVSCRMLSRSQYAELYEILQRLDKAEQAALDSL